MRVLVSAFEPFGGSAVNPSHQVLMRLVADPPPEASIEPCVLPVVGERAPKMLVSTLVSTQPDALLMLGESGTAASITFERVAINLRDYRIADNAGSTVVDRPVRDDGPAAYFATLPVRVLADACRAVGVPAELSLSAGSYLCNEVMYAALDRAAHDKLHIPIGFIHVPQLPEQALDATRGRPTMACDTTIRGIRAVIKALATYTAARSPGAAQLVDEAVRRVAH